jgi:hypothetical protein
MTNVALVDVDNSEKVKFPNLVLMKASTYYKALGYNVKLIHGNLLNKYNREFERGLGIVADAHKKFFPDIVIKSKVFTWTKDKNLYSNGEYLQGGTGIDPAIKIDPEIDRAYPDYDLYKGLYRQHSKQFEDAGIGFITRGCYRKCSFCFVPKKEGMIKPYMKIEDFKKPDSDNLIMLDNNIIAHAHGRREIQRMVDMGLHVDFNQGLDPHIIAAREHIAELLSGLKWINQVRLACDEQKDKEPIKEAVRLLKKHNCKGRLFAYTIITPDVDEAYDRIKWVDSLGVIPYAQSLRDTINTPPTVYMQALQRWVSSAVGGGFFAFSFEDYLNNLLRYDPIKKRFREAENRTKITKEWSEKHKGENRGKRSMELSGTIQEIVDRKIKADTDAYKKEQADRKDDLPEIESMDYVEFFS